MSGFNEVKAKLRKSAQDGSGAQTVVRYDAADEGVRQVLEWINASVIGRRLEIRFGSGVQLGAVCASCRLVSLFSPAPEGLHPEEAALFSASELASDDAKRVAKFFFKLCEMSTEFRVTTGPVNDSDVSSGQGIRTNAIAAALNLSMQAESETDQSQSVERFLNALGEALISAILIDGEDVSPVHGGEEELAFLLEWADAVLEPLLSPDFPLLGSLETNGLLVFTVPAQKDRHIVVAGKHSSFVAAMIRGIETAGTVNIWRALNLDGFIETKTFLSR